MNKTLMAGMSGFVTGVIMGLISKFEIMTWQFWVATLAIMFSAAFNANISGEKRHFTNILNGMVTGAAIGLVSKYESAFAWQAMTALVVICLFNVLYAYSKD